MDALGGTVAREGGVGFKKKIRKLSQERLREVLEYNPDTGVFTRRGVGQYKNREGAIAGATDGRGYRQMRVDGVIYYAHRLAFLYMEGYLPRRGVSHRNNIFADNRWENLYEVKGGKTERFAKEIDKDLSKISGVFWDVGTGKFRANIRSGGRVRYIGVYMTAEEAAFARLAAEQCLGVNWKKKGAYQYLKEKGVIRC